MLREKSKSESENNKVKYSCSSVTEFLYISGMGPTAHLSSHFCFIYTFSLTGRGALLPNVQSIPH